MVHFAAFTDPGLQEALLSAFLRAMRVFAFVTGTLVAVDSCGLLLGIKEVPPHRPRANALAWLFASGFACIASGWLLAHQTVWITAATDIVDRFAAALTWVGFGIAFTVRAVTRSKRPWLTVGSAVLMGAFGTFLAFVSPIP